MRGVAALAAFAAAAATCEPGQAFEIKPLGCRGAYATEIHRESLSFLQDGYGLGGCGREERPMDCRATHDYLVVHMGNQPVHEAITRSAYRMVYGRPITTYNFESPLVSGTLWNDDPQWLLRKAVHDRGRTQVKRFADLMEQGEKHPDASSLTVRSHFGDLQFLHAMRGRGQTEAQARRRLRAWVEGAHEVATGRLAVSTPVTASRFVDAVGELKCGRNESRSCTIREALDREGRFWAHVPGEVGVLNLRFVAAGTILHILQDAHSESHSTVEQVDGQRRRVSRTYDDDNRAHHCTSDMATARTRAAIEKAIGVSAAYLRLFRAKSPAADVLALLDSEGFVELRD